MTRFFTGPPLPPGRSGKDFIMRRMNLDSGGGCGGGGKGSEKAKGVDRINVSYVLCVLYNHTQEKMIIC